MDEKVPCIRMDLDFLPVEYRGEQFILVRDHLGLVEEGKAVPPQLYQFIALLDGRRTIKDLQTEIMRYRGGILVSTDELLGIINHLDESFMLESQRFRLAKAELERTFAGENIRPCTHCGSAYPNDSGELKVWLEQILADGAEYRGQGGRIKALVSPHIDISVGRRFYGTAYRTLAEIRPEKIVVLGVGHHLREDFFCLTEKYFETPLGITKSDRGAVRELREAGGNSVSRVDFEHKGEHSIEFQLVFLQHILGAENFEIVPILCGSLHSGQEGYGRDVYLRKAEPFLSRLRNLLAKGGEGTLLVAGIDLSHIGPKFGHEAMAGQLEKQAKAHDKKLLDCFCSRDVKGFWEESIRVRDSYNVCGLSAMACMLEVLPSCKGEVLGYTMWNEEATRSAVSFSAVVFTS